MANHLKDTVCLPLANRFAPYKYSRDTLAIRRHSSAVPYGRYMKSASRSVWQIVSIAYLLLSKSMPNRMLESSSRLIETPSNRKLVMRWKLWEVIVISKPTMWKVWVVSHHLSAKVYAKTALANLSGIKQTTGLNLQHGYDPDSPQSRWSITPRPN